jgi:hypothetical protein
MQSHLLSRMNGYLQLHQQVQEQSLRIHQAEQLRPHQIG